MSENQKNEKMKKKATHLNGSLFKGRISVC